MVDPIRFLPNEAIVAIFSLLSTEDIAISGSVSKQWRAKIRTDPSINRIIDLSLQESSEEDMIELVRRLCSLSTHPDRELHLYVSCFFEKFRTYSVSVDGAFDFESLMEATSFKFLDLISAIASATKGNLGKLSFLVDSLNHLGEHQGQLGELLLHTSRSLEAVKEIHWQLPFPVSVEARAESRQNGARTVSIVNNAERACYDEKDKVCWDTAKSCVIFLRDLVGLVGSLVKLDLNLTRIKTLQHELNDGGEDEILVLCQEIRKSKESLEELSLTFHSYPSLSDLWSLVTSCSSLSSLKLGRGNLLGESSKLEKPTDIPSFKLKSLTLSLYSSGVLDWLVDWVGPELESLHLIFGLGYMFGAETFDSSRALSRVLETSSSLKDLELQGLSLSDLSSSAAQVSLLSKLQSISLTDLNRLGYEFFSELSMPQLQTLEFKCRDRLTAEDAIMVSLYKILRNSSQSLVKLHARIKLGRRDPGGGTGAKGRQMETILLPRMKVLELESCSGHVWDLVSICTTHQLKTIQIERSPVHLGSLFKLLRSNSTHLESFSLERLSTDELEDVRLEVRETVLLPNLQHLSIESSNLEVFRAFSKVVVSDLKTLNLRSGSAQSLPEDLLSFVTSSASSLEELTILDDAKENQREEKSQWQDIQLELPKVTRLLAASSSPTGQCLLNHHYPRLASLDIYFDERGFPPLQVLEFFGCHSSTIDHLYLHFRSVSSVEKEASGSDYNGHRERVRFEKLRSLWLHTGMTSELLERLFSVDGLKGLERPVRVRDEGLREALSEIAPKLTLCIRYQLLSRNEAESWVHQSASKEGLKESA